MPALDGKRAILTGAAQGLGAALLDRLLREGCSVAAWDLNATQMRATAEEAGARHARTVLSRAIDVTDAEAVRAAVEEDAAALGGLELMVCNAGILISGDSTELSADHWRRVIEVNLSGYFFCAREAARVMLPRGGGAIVQINSKSGKKGSAKNCAYAASKFGGIGVTQSLALEFAERGVRVNSVCPGNLLDSPLWVNSLFKQYARNQGISEAEVRQKYLEQVPMKRACTYDDVANVVVFLASDAASYMTGQAINVTGGQEMR
jgi:sorbitol-6-phosphate 2-dehydrogenase